MTRTYPDTEAGVRRLLHDETDLHPAELTGTNLRPDPHTPGAWLVTLTDGRRFLAYVGAHRLAPAFEDVAP